MLMTRFMKRYLDLKSVDTSLHEISSLTIESLGHLRMKIDTSTFTS
jgi:hypothetical protein